MPALNTGAVSRDEPRAQLHALAALVLVRISAEGGATRAGLVRDLSSFVSHKLSPAEWRSTAEAQIESLQDEGLITDARGRLHCTPNGQAATGRYLVAMKAGASWMDLRDIGLIAKALAIENEAPGQIKALGKPEGLRAIIVQKAFGLPLKGNQSASRLRSQLVVVALERAFGNKIKRGLGTGSGVSSKAGRILAGQLSRRPQDYGTDGRLVAALAAENSGSLQTDHDAVRLALLRGYVSRALAETLPAPPSAQSSSPALDRHPRSEPARAPAPANDTSPLAATPAIPNERPDMAAFVAEVQSAARARAEGWPGNRKAFISLVWQIIRDSHRGWGLSEIEFKCMLAEAHRAGRIVLANADLKDKKHLKEFEDSAIPYKNTVWHFVRVEE